jgi:hypothetical protein
MRLPLSNPLRRLHRTDLKSFPFVVCEWICLPSDFGVAYVRLQLHHVLRGEVHRPADDLRVLWACEISMNPTNMKNNAGTGTGTGTCCRYSHNTRTASSSTAAGEVVAVRAVHEAKVDSDAVDELPLEKIGRPPRAEATSDKGARAETARVPVRLVGSEDDPVRHVEPFFVHVVPLDFVPSPAPL